MYKTQRKFINDAKAASHLLNEWEKKFINDLSEKSDDYNVSDKQNDIINRIQKKVEAKS